MAGRSLDWYDYGARFYEPELGRWQVIDPMAEKHFDYTSYAYVINNPLLYKDSLGLDTLKVDLPSDRTRQGTATLTVNGADTPLEGGSQVLGKGVTNGGTNPTRDPMKEKGDTPTGEATATTVLDRDTDGKFVNTDGTPVKDPKGTPNGQVKAQGRYFILLNPESGDISTSGRTELGMHGGGTALGTNALQAQQPLVCTNGCLRFTNQTAAQLAGQVSNATQNNRTFRVIIRQLPGTSASSLIIPSAVSW